MTSYFLRVPRKLRDKLFDRRLEALLPELYRLALSLTNTPADAEDLVHDACVKALASHADADLPSAAACRAWVRSILINCFRDRYRREQRTTAHHATVSDHSEADNIIEFVESSEPSPEDWAVFSDLESSVQSAVAALPPEVRIVTMLFMVDGKNYKEIAAIADCPIGTVMSRLFRGRRMLRTALERSATGSAGNACSASGK